jgi:RNA polymerase sigma factor (sigma-70 family)
MSAIVLNAVMVSDSPVPADAELVERFVSARDQAAFAELVRRHSGVVLGVCHRMLRDSHDIDDVFQATFLVLVRDAARLRKQKSLASWLYGIAFRLSLRLVRQKHRRRETALVNETLIDDDSFEQLTARYDQQLVDVELNALPERYRQPLVLRYLSGLSTNEIATELETTVGTVEGLLKRGKDQLRRRLVQRGLTLGAALVAVQAAQQTTHAAETLIETTIQAGLAWTPGTNGPTSDLVSDRAIELAGKEVIAMTATTKTAIAIGLTLGGLVIGAGGVNALTGRSDARDEFPVIDSRSSITTSATESTAIAAIPENPSSNLAAKREKDLSVSSTEKNNTSVKRDVLSPGSSKKQWDSKPRTSNEIKIEDALANQTEVSFVDTPLKEALRYLEDLHSIRIQIDEPALRDEGIATDTNINLAMSEIKLQSALGMALEPLGLDYVIKNEAMLITTRDRASEAFDTRVYNIEALQDYTPEDLKDMIALTIAPNTWKVPTQVTGGMGGDGKGGGGMGGGGGVKGAIHPTAKSLVIRQNQRVHNEITDLLNQLHGKP